MWELGPNGPGYPIGVLGMPCVQSESLSAGEGSSDLHINGYRTAGCHVTGELS